MSNDDLKIPESVKNYWSYENKEYSKDLFVKDVLKDILNIDYVPEYEFIFNGIDKILKEKDPLAFKFLSQISEK